MANDEMNTIKELDLPLLQECKVKLHFYYADRDDWVGEEKDRVLRALHPDREVLSVVHDTHDIPHAFCISTSMTQLGGIHALKYSTVIIDHGDQLSEQCFSWLQRI